MQRKSIIAVLAVALSCGMAMSAAGETIDMGHCSDDQSVAPENVIIACNTFITRAYQENWRVEYVPLAMIYQALGYERENKLGWAQAELNTVVTRFRTYDTGWLALGEFLERHQGPGSMMGVLDAMVQANPENAHLLNIACWTRAKRGEQLDKALENCNKSLQLSPGDANTLDSRALVRFRKGDYPSAIADASAALAANPKLAGSLYVRGVAKVKSGDAAGGKADIGSAKALNASVADTYADYGVAP